MYTRNVRIKLRANCAPEFKRILEEEIIPLSRKQKAFRDEMFFVAPDRNEAIAPGGKISDHRCGRRRGSRRRLRYLQVRERQRPVPRLGKVASRNFLTTGARRG
jgi:hypothetical protein